MQRRHFLRQATAASASLPVITFGLASPARAATTPSVVVTWNQALLASIAATRTQAPIAARAISMVHEAVYNAWATFDGVAAFTLWGLYKQHAYCGGASSLEAVKAAAICHAARAVLVDLFPDRQPVFDALLAASLPGTGSSGTDWLAQSAGQRAADALLTMRHADGANQLGNLAPGAYSDWTGYQPVNGPDTVVDPTRWQPLRVIDPATGVTLVQKFLTPHWFRVKPFALWSASAFRPMLYPRAPTMSEMQQVIDFSANLTVAQRAQVELWAANPGTVSPPGQWMQIAELVSAYDGNTLDKDVKLFFGCAQALLDASIAAWDCKRAFDSVRPITAIRYYFRNQAIRSWAGPGLGTQTILGQDWKPYQRPTNPTPPFAEFISGHSTFSQAAASVLGGIRASDGINFTLTVRAGQIPWEQPPFPPAPMVFSFGSLPQAVDSAGTSRRLGGIHFERGDYNGRNTGRAVGDLVLARCRALFEGRNV